MLSIIFNSDKRQASEVRGNSYESDCEFRGSLNVRSLLCLSRACREHRASHHQPTGLRKDGNGLAGQFLLLILPPGRTPGDPTFPTYREVTMLFITRVTDGSLEVGFSS